MEGCESAPRRSRTRRTASAGVEGAVVLDTGFAEEVADAAAGEAETGRVDGLAGDERRRVTFAPTASASGLMLAPNSAPRA